MKRVGGPLLWEPDAVLDFVHICCGRDIDLEVRFIALMSALDNFSDGSSLQRGI